MHKRQRWLTALSMVWCALVSVSAWSQTALVTDVTGRVTVAGGKADVAILSDLQRGARVKLENGARLTVTYLKSGDEYLFNGPGEFMVEEAAPRALTGTAPQRRVNNLAKAVTLNAGGVTQAAIVMRGAVPATRIKVLGPDGSKALDATPVFAWQSVTGVKTYQFQLQDQKGETLFERQVEGVSYRLADAALLKPGAAYTWQVSAQDGQGKPYAGSAKFSVAAVALRQEVERLTPRPDAAFSERVAYAAWLQQEELKDEARRYWRALSAERPEDPVLKRMASEP